MRLILEAFQNLAAPTRRTRRLMRRPYYPDARMFFEMTAPTYSIDSTRMIRFLADPDAFNAGPGARRCRAPTPSGDGGLSRLPPRQSPPSPTASPPASRHGAAATARRRPARRRNATALPRRRHRRNQRAATSVAPREPID